MSFMIFKLLFAALALALLVVAGLIVRQLMRKRQPSAPKPRREAAPKAAKLRKPSPAETTSEPDPAPARRRQLQSFAEAERTAAEAEAEAIVLPVAEPVAEPAAEPTFQPVAETEVEPAAEPVAEPAASHASAPDYSQAVLGRLEEAFEALQADQITLDAYRTRVLAEQAAVEQRVALLQAGGASPALDDALAARESVRWCLDWAAEQAGPPEG